MDLPDWAEDLSNFVKDYHQLPMENIVEPCHYIICCLIVRDDVGKSFSRQHPLALWLSCMLACFAGTIVSGLLLGDPLILPFSNSNNILIASMIFYLVFYSPVDVFHKVSTFLPIHGLIYFFKEVRRSKRVLSGVQLGHSRFPNASLIMMTIGATKGCGSAFVRPFSRLLCGIWKPTSHEAMTPSTTTKVVLIGALLYCLRLNGLIQVPLDVLEFFVSMLFLVVRSLSLFFSMTQPFRPFENLLSYIFFGGLFHQEQSNKKNK